MGDEPMISIKLSDFDRQRQNTRDLEARLYQLEADLAAAKLADSAGTLRAFHAAFHDAMQVVQFAVGNLAPETVAGWPYEALGRLAEALDKLPSIDRHLSEAAGELREFSRQASGLEAWRKERDKHRVVVAATAADFGPQTDEARAIHAARIKLNEPPPA